MMACYSSYVNSLPSVLIAPIDENICREVPDLIEPVDSEAHGEVTTRRAGESIDARICSSFWHLGNGGASDRVNNVCFFLILEHM